jgi:acetate kinase
MLGMPRDQVRLITLHLGNGCSACAIQGGNSVQTSMGFTPLPGLLMGTRAGDLDPSVLEFLNHKEGFSLPEMDTLLNKQSGLLGISGLTGDMRELLEEAAENDDRRALLAIELFCRRARSYIGAYLAECGPVEAVCFTGGIGENSREIRERILRPLEPLGIEIDTERNDAVASGASAKITTESSRIAAWVIPTNEELLIARDTYRVVEDRPRRW